MIQRKSCFVVMFRAMPTEKKSSKSDCTDSFGAIFMDFNSRYSVLLDSDVHSSDATRLRNVTRENAAENDCGRQSGYVYQPHSHRKDGDQIGLSRIARSLPKTSDGSRAGVEGRVSLHQWLEVFT